VFVFFCGRSGGVIGVGGCHLFLVVWTCTPFWFCGVVGAFFSVQTPKDFFFPWESFSVSSLEPVRTTRFVRRDLPKRDSFSTPIPIYQCVTPMDV